jgi:hypothetical protein
MNIEKLITLRQAEQEFRSSHYWKMEQIFRREFPHKIDRFYESTSQRQIMSKQWLVNELAKVYQPSNPINIEIIGGWFGFPLIDLLYSKFNINRIHFFEIEDLCKDITSKYNVISRYNIDIDYDGSRFALTTKTSPDLVINTAQEHMLCLTKEMYANNPMIAVHSNNCDWDDEHWNAHTSLQNFIDSMQLNTLYYSGEKYVGEFDRYQLIGTFK